MRFSAREQLPCPSGRHVRPRAQRARLKVSSTFSKVVESRGKVSGRPPQRAKFSFCLLKIRKGVQGGNPIKGFPPCFAFVRVRRYVSRDFDPGVPFRPHFFGPCPKKRCRAAKERRLALNLFDSGSHYTPAVSACGHSANRNVPFAPGEGEVVGNLPVNAPGSLRRGRTCRPDGQGSCFR